jgi:hypothetical protein
MIKAFIISFDFEGKTYLALASFHKGADAGLSYSIHFYDDALTKIIPQDCYQHANPESWDAQQNRLHPLANRLHHSIKESIEAHLLCIRE